MALRQRSRVIRFRSAAEMLDFFHLFKDGKRYRRIMEGFQRIFAATILFGTNDELNGKPVLDWARFHFFGRMCLWFHKVEGEPVGFDSDENSIVLRVCDFFEVCSRYIHFQAVGERRGRNLWGFPGPSDELDFPWFRSFPGA